jgi:hypothetical protein
MANLGENFVSGAVKKFTVEYDDFGEAEQVLQETDCPEQAEFSYFMGVIKAPSEGRPTVEVRSRCLEEVTPGCLLVRGLGFNTPDHCEPLENKGGRQKQIWAHPGEGWTGPTIYQLKALQLVARQVVDPEFRFYTQKQQKLPFAGMDRLITGRAGGGTWWNSRLRTEKINWKSWFYLLTILGIHPHFPRQKTLPYGWPLIGEK